VPMFMVVSSWHSHLTECSMCARWLPTFGSSQSVFTHFTIPRRVEGWVDLVGWRHTKMVYLPIDSHQSQY